MNTQNEPNEDHKESLQWHIVSSLEHCDHQHLRFMAQKIMDQTFSVDPNKPWTAKPEVNEQLISFLEHKQLDGVGVKEYQRKQFSKDLVAFCGNKKVTGPATKLCAALKAMEDEAQIERFKEKLNLNTIITENDNSSMKVCESASC